MADVHTKCIQQEHAKLQAVVNNMLQARLTHRLQLKILTLQVAG